MKSPAARPLWLFYERIRKEGQGKKKALVALARKLLTVAYRVLKSELPYDPYEDVTPGGVETWA
jgi:hypothetical protein